MPIPAHGFPDALCYAVVHLSKSELMNVLVAGGAGYIGSVVTAALLEAGHHPVVLDNLSHGHRAAVPASVPFIEADLADRARIESALREHRTEAVLHFAAFIEAGESMREPARFFRNNSACTLNLLEAMLAAGVNKIVFSSTAALFGNPERTPISENDPLHPTNPYGESKLIVEQMLSWFHQIHGLRYAALRYFNAAGATETLGEAHHPETHLIPLVLQVAAGKRPSIAVYGTDYPTHDGTCVRDYIHVSDLADAHVLALNALREHTRVVYNLGNGRGFSVREVIETARRVTGHAIPAVDSPRRPGDPAILVASSERIKQELGWKPKFADLDSIISSAWRWHQLHPKGY